MNGDSVNKRAGKHKSPELDDLSKINNISREFHFQKCFSRLHLRSEVRGLRRDGPCRQGDRAVQAVLQGQCPRPEQDQSQLRCQEYRIQEEMSSWL